MKLLYINDELATGDGSNYHAFGILKSFEDILGQEDVLAFPKAEDGSGKQVNHTAGGLKQVFKGPLQYIRFFRKKYLSVKRSKLIVKDLKAKGFIPTHVIARSTVFDVTAIYVARSYGAKLIYEFNTPEYYERGVIKKEPLVGAIEKWEKRVLEESAWVYINSNTCRDMLCNHYKLSSDKFFVVPNGYMSELYKENDIEREHIRKEIRNEKGFDDKFVVTFIGSLKSWHGINTICETAELLENEKDICFLIMGDGDMHDIIVDYSSNHKNMVFLGKVNLETMKKYLYASDLGIMPYSKQENFYYSPLKMFDMIGAGLPFIGTAIGQIEEFCTRELDEKFLAYESDSKTFASLIIERKKEGLIYMKKLVKDSRNNNSWRKRTDMLIKKMIES